MSCWTYDDLLDAHAALDYVDVLRQEQEKGLRKD